LGAGQGTVWAVEDSWARSAGEQTGEVVLV
jgi:hypothetical protein